MFNSNISLKALVKRIMPDFGYDVPDNSTLRPASTVMVAPAPESYYQPKVTKHNDVLMRLRCTVTNLHNLYRSLKYVSKCEFLETVRNGDQCEITLRVGQVNCAREIVNEVKTLTGKPVLSEITTSASKILMS